MPEPIAFDRGAMLALFENSSGMGGIVFSPNYRGLSVEIRPPKWKKKIWIGKLETLKLAQHVRDAVRYYAGMPPLHGEGVMTLPSITCIGTVIGTPVKLSTLAMCASYVREIAKGQDFKPQREDFILQVRKVVKHPDFPVLAPPRTDDEPDDDVDRDDDGDWEDECIFDKDTESALQMSLHSGSSGVPVAVVQTHVSAPDFVGEAVQAYVPSFDVELNDSESILRSVGQCIDANIYSLDDCRIEDEKIWIEFIEELDSESTAAGASIPSVTSNDCGVCRDGFETLPILNIPPIVKPCASTFSKSFSIPVEGAVPSRTALCSASDLPSSQFAKRQKIED